MSALAVHYWLLVVLCWHYDGGGGFFLTYEDLGRMFDRSFPNCPVSLFLFFEVEISLGTVIPLFMPGSVHSGSEDLDDWGQTFSDNVLGDYDTKTSKTFCCES